MGVGVVDSLVGVAKDVNASTACLFSSSGFTRPAEARARKEQIACVHLPFAKRFDEFVPATGHGYYSGEYSEDCLCSTPANLAFTYGRITYADRDENSWTICNSLSMDWANVKAIGFVAYIPC